MRILHDVKSCCKLIKVPYSMKVSCLLYNFTIKKLRNAENIITGKNNKKTSYIILLFYLCTVPVRRAREREYSSVLFDIMPSRANCSIATKNART